VHALDPSLVPTTLRASVGSVSRLLSVEQSKSTNTEKVNDDDDDDDEIPHRNSESSTQIVKRALNGQIGSYFPSFSGDGSVRSLLGPSKLRTEPSPELGYCQHNVVCLSVCLSVWNDRLRFCVPTPL